MILKEISQFLEAHQYIFSPLAPIDVDPQELTTAVNFDLTNMTLFHVNYYINPAMLFSLIHPNCMETGNLANAHQTQQTPLTYYYLSTHYLTSYLILQQVTEKRLPHHF